MTTRRALSTLIVSGFCWLLVPDHASSTPQGGIVHLGEGRRVAMHCRGRGRFTVLLEPGDGGRRSHMAALAGALSKRYRVCDYDRRNRGDSSVAPLPRQAVDLTADAFDALTAAGERGPFILFGSSLGGLLVRAEAATYPVAGFVTSNQPGTPREWARFAGPAMSAAERAADAAWVAGDNIEHIDVASLGAVVDNAPPPTVPYVIMVSTERFQRRAAGICGRVHDAFVAASRAVAHAGRRGRLRLIDGDHDLYVTNQRDVIAAIDSVAVAALRRP